MPALVARGNTPSESWLIIDAFLAIIFVVVGAVLVYWVRRYHRQCKQRKALTKERLDIEACTPVQDDKTVHTTSKPECYQVPSIPAHAHIPLHTTRSQRRIMTTSEFNSFTPIHDRAIRMPKAGDYSAVSQVLKKSFGEGGYSFRQVVDAAITDNNNQVSILNNAPKQSSSVVVSSGKSCLASTIEGKATTEVVIQECDVSASPIQEQTRNKTFSRKFLDVKAWITKKNTHTSTSSDLQTTSVIDFTRFAPIHDHLVLIPSNEDYCVASQRLKRSFSEGIRDHSRYPHFPVRSNTAPPVKDALHSRVFSDGIPTKQQPSCDVASSGSSQRTLIDGTVQERCTSISVSACDMIEENSPGAVEIPKVNTKRGDGLSSS